MNKEKIFIFLRQTGPYHHARFNFMAGVFDTHVIETRPMDTEYDWESNFAQKGYVLHKIESLEKGILKNALQELIVKEKPTIIFVTGWGDKENLLVLYLAKQLGIPVATFSDSNFDDKKRNYIVEQVKSVFVKNFDTYLVAGSRSKAYLEYLGIHKGIFQPYDVVDNNYFHVACENLRIQQSNFSISLPEKYILCFSRFIEKKNLLILIEAYNKAGNLKYDLVIAGSGPLKNQILEKVSSSPKRSQIHITDFVQYGELPYYYSKASALILASTSDQWGLVVNEAMASGLPVLVSKNCGCADDLVKDSVNGFTFEPSFDGIKECLSKFNTLTEEDLVTFGKSSADIINSFSLESFSNAIKDCITFAQTTPPKKLGLISKVIFNFLIA